MARQTLSKTRPLPNGWAITLTDVSRHSRFVDAWFAAGEGAGPFYAYSPYKPDDVKAQVVFEPQWEKVEGGQRMVTRGQTSLASIPGSGQDHENEQRLLRDTGLTLEQIDATMEEMVTEVLTEARVLA